MCANPPVPHTHMHGNPTHSQKVGMHMVDLQVLHTLARPSSGRHGPSKTVSRQFQVHLHACLSFSVDVGVERVWRVYCVCVRACKVTVLEEIPLHYNYGGILLHRYPLSP